MSDTVVEHIWMADRRSLCDRDVVQRPYVDLSDDEYEIERAAQANSSACGACLLLVAHIRRQAAAILSERETVWPEKPSEAWKSLEDTRWAAELELSSLPENVDETTRFDAITLAVHPEAIAALVESRRVKREALDQYRRAMRGVVGSGEEALVGEVSASSTSEEGFVGEVSTGSTSEDVIGEASLVGEVSTSSTREGSATEEPTNTDSGEVILSLRG